MAEIILLLIGAATAFVSAVIIMGKRPSEVQKWYALAAVGLFIYMTANYIKRHEGGDPKVFFYLQEAIYMSSTVFHGAFLFGTAEALEIRFSHRIKRIIGGIILADCLLIMTFSWHTYFYRDIILFPNPNAEGLYMNETPEGWLYYAYIAYSSGLTIFFGAFLLWGLFRKKGNKTRLLRLLILALLLPIITSVLYVTRAIPTALGNHCSYLASNISMLILMLRYDVTMTIPVIKEQAIETSQNGIIIMDRHRHFQFANETAKAVFPQLTDDNPDAVSEFIWNELTGERIQKDGKEYEIRLDEELDSARRVCGYLLVIRDITEREKARRKEQELAMHEMAMAREIQGSALPHTFPPFPDRDEIDLFASMDPARDVGGDFYDFFLIDDDHLCLVMADVSGKGIPAALFMMVAKRILEDCAKLGQNASGVLNRMNESLCSDNQTEMFVTVWLGILEISTGRLTAANAGHEYPAICRNGGRFELYKDKHGFVIGGMNGVRYREYELRLDPGDKLFVYTDGVPEATAGSGEMFGTERMVEALNAAAGGSPREILNGVRHAVDAFVGGAEQFDDLTMLCLEYRGRNDRT